ncbi:hypothetical protein SAMN05216382_0099 [Sphingomonas palmae]|uniref:Bacterial dipeptidyl-peptidase SH3 domain-containing protein n=1 Tax=Sphingomonas palmae TaxID=1855283 RepID=A0A1H7FPL5_9SPHN|nr:SH3 domain-containing protein [Sphingomonas palmae]SEK27724.1 hypothetical protein SAMN05216382_0099 [Sphingomonas palmae]
MGRTAAAHSDSVSAREARRTFALSGPSVRLDPTTNAVRADIADVRLADRVFAPHYAAPLRRTVVRDTGLRDGRAIDGAVIASLASGSAFDLLDLTGGVAWGIAVDAGLVGYVDADDVAAK